MQTPQRPLPGAFFSTPAASRFDTRAPPPPIFRSQSQSFGGQGAALGGSNPAGQQQPPLDQSRHQNQIRSLQPIQRAARTINETLLREASFPEIDSYIRRKSTVQDSTNLANITAEGISSDYDLPDSYHEAAWAPFQRTKMYNIPDRVFEQWNRAEVSTSMGLFAELNHAWVCIDNSLYLWDYTNPNPEIIGYEELQDSITAVKLVKPREGVFVKAITHLLVVATTTSMNLLGVETPLSPSGVRSVSLYQTRMTLSIRGISVQTIEGSPATGRIFFAGEVDNEVYELTYQQEEKWFSSRCGKINHTSPGYQSLVPALWSGRTKEHVVSMVVDDTRKLVYTLSSESSIRTFYLDSPTTLVQVIEKRRQECLRDISHMISPSPLLPNSMKIVSISPISAKEGSKLHLMATTSTGCRLFLSATKGYGYLNTQGAPQSMQVQHIKFPPRATTPPAQPGQMYTPAEPATEVSSTALVLSKTGLRFPPGFFICFVCKQERPDRDAIFLSGPDTGRIALQSRDLTAQATRYYEQGNWLDLNSIMEDIGLVTPPFAAAAQTLGFGNELAVQFDQPPTEFAVLTNNGIHIIRRRRLVDMFAAAIRNHGGDEGLENEIKKFIRQYGRGETTATALAVACGQGSDVAPSGEARLARISDPETLELARKCYVEFGGRPSLDQNSISEGPAHMIDNVRPSSRHEGLALYMSRLVRSLWKASVITQMIEKTGSVSIVATIKIPKLISVQEDLTRLSQFLEKNKSFIEGLAGPDGFQRAASQQEDIALQGEHQALHSLLLLNLSIIEGISFVQMLFDERVDEIWTSLDDATKQQLRDLTYELLFSTDQGKDLAKTLVKAIVNRNIASGSNVDTVADALRRRCGSFCSADDVVIFKAQEQLKKASELGSGTEGGRALLNESLRLFNQVAGALGIPNLHTAADQFAQLQFYAGAIQLCLHVARELDRGNKALAWVKDGKPAGDSRVVEYNNRKNCYDFIHTILVLVDQQTGLQPEIVDGRPSIIATKRNEAYAVVNDSDDELFHFDLYEWYLSQGWSDRLLSVQSPFAVRFLTQIARIDADRADLLWKFYSYNGEFFNAAVVQLDLAKSNFQIPLVRRIQYLSSAKANASTQSGGVGRQQRQVLLYEVNELLEVANIQDEILQAFRADARVANPARRAAELKRLDGQILPLDSVSALKSRLMAQLTKHLAIQRLRRPSILL
jgi:nuclear pore complex protein Nup155